MQKYLHALLSATALVTAFAAPAIAADAVAPAADALYTAENPFAGFYIGVHAGGSTSTADETSVYHDGEWSDFYSNYDWYWASTDGDFSQDATGYLAGVQAGANVVTGGFLMGAEVRGSISTDSSGIKAYDDCIDGDFMCSGDFDYTDLYFDTSFSIDSLVIAQGKVGFATEQFAVYATAGLAMAHLNLYSNFYLDTSDSEVGQFDSVLETSGWVPGYTVGLGAEVMVGDDVSIGLNYNYVDYGTVETEGMVDFTAQSGTGTAYGYRTDHVTQQVVSAQINKFF